MLLQLEMDPEKSKEVQLAELAMGGVADSAITSFVFNRSAWAESDLTHCMKQLQSQVSAVNSGDMKQVEAMLVGQTSALSSIFHECVRRSAQNMGQHPKVMEQYMRLGLKAQSQCRTTLESLAEIKSPRSVAFVRQANIANGHQQVNNGVPGEARADETNSQPNKLYEVVHEQSLDARSPSQSSRSHQDVEALGAIHRPDQRRRKGGREQ